MKAQKSMAGIFKDLAKNRQDARRAQVAYVVVGVKANGEPYKVTPQDLDINGCATQDAAEVRKAHMTQLNPGRTYTIVTR